MNVRESGCPACPHSVSGFHCEADPCTYPASPKATAPNLYCVWCEAWCVRGGVVLTAAGWAVLNAHGGQR